jgi:3-deoxy-D-manno-octulosonic-acid transferase
MLFLYRALYAISFVAMLPYMLYVGYVRRKNMHIKERLFPTIGEESLQGCYIFHAVSVGETHAIAALVRKVREAFPERHIVVTNVTHTGHQTAKKLFPDANCLFLPFDFSFSVRRFFKVVRPALVVISEGDIWPEFLHQAKELHASTIIVNGSVSDRSYRRLRLFPTIARWRFRDIDHFCVQNQLFATRLQQLGLEKKNISVTGSMKADCFTKPLSKGDKEALRVSLGITKGETIIVVGSTHDPEEDLICSALAPLLDHRPDVKILVVPRHPERFSIVYINLAKKFRGVAAFSRLPHSGWNILVIDAMGMLCNLYQIAHIAIVAGSFTKAVGGHNIVEPALAGIPCIVGPYMHSQKALLESAEAHKAVIQVDQSGLCREVDQLINDPQRYSLCVSQTQSWVRDIQGATDRTFQSIRFHTQTS